MACLGGGLRSQSASGLFCLFGQNVPNLLNTQLVQDIIKTCIHTEMRKKDIKHSGKKAYTHKNTIKSKA